MKKDKKERTPLDKRTKKFLIGWLVVVAILFVLCLIVPGAQSTETIQELMRDAVLHEENRIDLFGIMMVNPSVISGFIVTAVILIAAIIIRIFFVPRFTLVPGRFQLIIEQACGLFYNMAKNNSPWRNRFLGAYIFCTGTYIFFGTLFELFGFQIRSVAGNLVALPAPLADINSAIMMGVLSYLVIVVGAVLSNGFGGLIGALKEFSLIISMPFRLFGALLSGLLVTELVYYYKALSYVLPVVVAIMFTLLHALIQAYVLTLLTSMFYGEKTEPKHEISENKI